MDPTEQKQSIIHSINETLAPHVQISPSESTIGAVAEQNPRKGTRVAYLREKDLRGEEIYAA